MENITNIKYGFSITFQLMFGAARSGNYLALHFNSLPSKFSTYSCFSVNKQSLLQNRVQDCAHKTCSNTK